MIIVTFTSYSSAREKLDEWNILASVQPGDELGSIYINEPEEGYATWAMNGTDCINNGGHSKAQISAQVENLPSFTVETYQDFFDLGYLPV